MSNVKYAVVLGWIVFFCSCGSGGDKTPPPEYPPLMQEETGERHQPAQAVPSEQPKAPDVRVVAQAHTPIEGQPPTLRVLSPRNGQVVKNGPVMVNAKLQRWELAPDPGNHVHVILDNEPYIAVRDLSKPINLSELAQQNLGHDLTPGTHVLRMFPSRAQHESVKEGKSFVLIVFHYQEKTEPFDFDPKAALLTYSRPKGCNKAGEPILLDFYLTNATLSPTGMQVKYSIDSQAQGSLTEWAPQSIESLGEGDHTVHLELVDAQGNPVPGMFNDTTRTIQVRADCGAP